MMMIRGGGGGGAADSSQYEQTNILLFTFSGEFLWLEFSCDFWLLRVSVPSVMFWLVDSSIGRISLIIIIIIKLKVITSRQPH